MSNGFLTTHVLDTATGQPAANMVIKLYQNDDLITTMTTNSDGRTDSPILAKEDFAKGTYRLEFHAGDYLRGQNATLPEPLFLDIIPIAFGINDAESHYHVPLLLSAHGYSTYRGS